MESGKGAGEHGQVRKQEPGLEGRGKLDYIDCILNNGIRKPVKTWKQGRY